MNLSSQGLTFLGLTARKYETPGTSPSQNFQAVQAKLQAFEQVGSALANTQVTISGLKNVNCQAYCMIDGQKQLISEKSWDRGGILEGKVPLEEGIANGLYHIENTTTQKAPDDLDKILENLKVQVSSDAASSLIPQAPTKSAIAKKDKNEDEKRKTKMDAGTSSFGFLS